MQGHDGEGMGAPMGLELGIEVMGLNRKMIRVTVATTWHNLPTRAYSNFFVTMNITKHNYWVDSLLSHLNLSRYSPLSLVGVG